MCHKFIYTIVVFVLYFRLQ